MIICQIVIGISVASTQGIEAEKNNIDETETTPTVNRAALGMSADWIAGKPPKYVRPDNVSAECHNSVMVYAVKKKDKYSAVCVA